MAREGYLLHAGEERIHPEGEKPAPQTPKSKWDNFWFYHKWHVLIALAVLIVGGYLVHSTLATSQPDYTVGVLTSFNYPQDALDALEKRIESCGVDRNGDGRVVVQVTNYTFSSGSDAQGSQLDMANRIKFEADLSSGTSVIFLTEPETFQAQQKALSMFAKTDGTAPKDKQADMASLRVPLKNCAKLSDLHFQVQLSSGVKTKDIFSNLGISLRLNGETIKGDDYAANKKLFDKLVKG